MFLGGGKQTLATDWKRRGVRVTNNPYKRFAVTPWLSASPA